MIAFKLGQLNEYIGNANPASSRFCNYQNRNRGRKFRHPSRSARPANSIRSLKPDGKPADASLPEGFDPQSIKENLLLKREEAQ